jgi:hypothetical protein
MEAMSAYWSWVSTIVEYYQADPDYFPWDKYQETSVITLILRLNAAELLHVDHPTPQQCLLAVRNCSAMLGTVPIPLRTPKMCMIAVQDNGYNLSWIVDQTPELCLMAVQSKGQALEWVIDQTPEICLAAVTNDGCALEYVMVPTLAICLAAVRQNKKALHWVPKRFRTPELLALTV